MKGKSITKNNKEIIIIIIITINVTYKTSNKHYY